MEWDDALGMAPMALRAVAGPIRQRLSSVKVGDGTVTVRNFPEWRRSFAFDQVSRFDWQQTEAGPVAVLILSHGRTVAVHALSDKRPGAVTELNNRMRATQLTSPGQPGQGIQDAEIVP